MTALAIMLAALAVAPPPAWRGQIAVDVVASGRETAYLLHVGRRFTLELMRSVRGTGLSPTLFSK